jgi:hypothetical protein
MVDIVLDSDELTVLGGPSQVQVEVDLGAQGDRGSVILSGSGDPNEITTDGILNTNGLELQPYDMYINTKQGNDYTKLYQYVTSDGNAPTWKQVLTLLPNIYSVNKTVTFNGGTGTIADISVSDITDLAGASSLQASNFNIQYSILGSSSIASAISVNDPTQNGKLPISIKAHEYNGTLWSALSGSKTVHLFITVV